MKADYIPLIEDMLRRCDADMLEFIYLLLLKSL